MAAKPGSRQPARSERIPDKLTTRQFGDACEYLVLAELLLAEKIAHKMPDGWPGYDISVSLDSDRDARVSVKSRRVGLGRTATAWSFEPETTKADWLALVTINMDDRSRRIYMVPHEWAMKNSRYHKTSGNHRMLIANPELERFRDNFTLKHDRSGHAPDAHGSEPLPHGSADAAAAPSASQNQGRRHRPFTIATSSAAATGPALRRLGRR